MAVGQLRDSRGRKSTTIHPLQSLSAPLSGAETGPCKCSLFWQTHPLHLHGTPYKAPWDKVSFFCFSLVPLLFEQFFHPCIHPFTSTQDFVNMCSLFVLSCRGNSKYHYYGIRVKPDSPLNRLQEDMQYMALRQQPVQQKQRYNGSYTCIRACSMEHSVIVTIVSILSWAMWFQVQASAEVWWRLWGKLLRWRPAPSRCSRADSHCAEPAPPAVPRSVAFLFIWMSITPETYEMHWNATTPDFHWSDYSTMVNLVLLITPTDASRALPDFVELDLGQSNTENISPEDVKALQSLYREHCEVR